MEAIDVLNADERAVNGSAVFGVNIFADLSTEEFTNYLGLKIPADDASRQSLMEVAPAAVDLYPNLANLESPPQSKTKDSAELAGIHMSIDMAANTVLACSSSIRLSYFLSFIDTPFSLLISHVLQYVSYLAGHSRPCS